MTHLKLTSLSLPFYFHHLTMSAARVTRSRTRTVSAVADLPVEKVAAPPAKKRKTQPKTKAEPVVVVPPPLPIAKYTPTAFNLDHAVSHLTSVDVRFATLFERIPCKPFLAAASEQSVAGAALAVAAAPEETETNGSTAAPQVDPFASLVKSIIGQQVSWQSARSITKRFVEHFCGPTDASGDEMRSGKGPFPTCEQVAASDVAALKGVGCSTRKAEYCES